MESGRFKLTPGISGLQSRQHCRAVINNFEVFTLELRTFLQAGLA
jgi:hypothetical protein